MAKSKIIYGLPIRKEDLEEVISDPNAHFGIWKHAIDFNVPEGTDVLAAADGEVCGGMVDFREGGDDPKYRNRANSLALKHANGEYSEYVHLRYDGAIKRMGEKVKKGEAIAYSGNTGYSACPHLHFHVFVYKDKNKNIWETIEPRLDEEIEIFRD